MKVLNVTTHLGGGLGTMIGSYISQSKLEHSVLELEKSINPCTDKLNLNIITLKNKRNINAIAMNHDILLVHYYCHPLIASALLEINRFEGNRVVVWCHNNGKNCLHPLPTNLDKMSDLVILSGCKDDRFSQCELVRPSPLMEQLEDTASNLSSINRYGAPSFRYIGSLHESKINKCAFNWFSYLSDKGEFDIATLDLEHRFSKFKVLIGVTNRKALYSHFFCLVYPLKDNHYGCGELVLQELLMLGYPVIIRRNNVETEIVDELTGVYFADSMNELKSVHSEIVTNWDSIISNWWIRSAHNSKVIDSRAPYKRLDTLLEQVYGTISLRQRLTSKPNPLDIIKFAYNQTSDDGLKQILSIWNQSGRGTIPTKGSPSQFLKYFPDLQQLLC